MTLVLLQCIIEGRRCIPSDSNVDPVKKYRKLIGNQVYDNQTNYSTSMNKLNSKPQYPLKLVQFTFQNVMLMFIRLGTKVELKLSHCSELYS